MRAGARAPGQHDAHRSQQLGHVRASDHALGRGGGGGSVRLPQRVGEGRGQRCDEGGAHELVELVAREDAVAVPVAVQLSELPGEPWAGSRPTEAVKAVSSCSWIEPELSVDQIKISMKRERWKLVSCTARSSPSAKPRRAVRARDLRLLDGRGADAAGPLQLALAHDGEQLQRELGLARRASSSPRELQQHHVGEGAQSRRATGAAEQPQRNASETAGWRRTQRWWLKKEREDGAEASVRPKLSMSSTSPTKSR